nr:SMP-30/gluconolactonase/LRE family protein [Parvibaculum sp.]
MGEGALWHPERHVLFWFDILGKELHWCNADGSGIGSHALEMTASAAVWIDSDTLLLAADDGFHRYSIRDRSFSLLAPLEADRPGNRSNDGRCDPWGRFWVGTMDRQAAPGRGALHMLGADLQPRCLKESLTIPNSIAFAPDRRHAYLSDSAEQTIFTLELDPESGEILDEHVFATTKGEQAVPDGSVVDSEGYLWNAQWDGWRVVRYRPDGKIDRIVELPVQRPTCPAFGGPDLRTLFVTSSREGLTASDLEKQPAAGGVFAFQADISGLPETPFRLTIAHTLPGGD